ncbi:ras GTPase-activating protein-binding protein 1-like [Clavelina lepadiformis]|uniref:ras GTPase-activating protein-binding protein 1-like n=1 Tax=Clavelina lepadiformis TaxID=159417 RepID=UPI0040432FF3
MVMMNKPSPIQVGREFVRQYYTLLNKAPELLYRFYSMSSSYVHGGRYMNGEPEKPVIGQNEIHQKIDSLNFCDCHTKIRQVDAHSTIGNGVVVQVTGELSNCGQPLRRFMQTFVLAPQGDNPYKFYVHNDIFRYQDEVFNDDVTTERSDDEQDLEEELEASQTVQQAPTGFQENLYNPPPEAESPVLTNGIEQRLEATTLDQRDTPTPPAPENAEPPASPRPSPSPEMEPEHASSPDPESPPEEPPKPPKDPEPVEEQEPADTKSTPKTFSWADLASKNTPAARTSTQQPTVTRTHRPPAEQPPEASEQTEAPRSSRAPRNNQRGHQRDDERAFGDRADGQRRVGGPGGGAGREQTGFRYPDTQQIFVGNLPNDVVDTELREHFTDFGNVLEVKINHSHTNNPSFGFVIFEDPKSVDHVLEVMPTHYKNNHRINIEEKKQRSSRDNNRRGVDMRRGGMAGDNRGGRRGPPAMRRDRQGSREGTRPNYNSGPRR